MAKNSAESVVEVVAEGGDKRQTASDFIREQGRGLKPALVVERGKAVGLEFTANLVSKVRRAEDAKMRSRGGGKLRIERGRLAKSVAPMSRVREKTARGEAGRRRRREAAVSLASEEGMKGRRGRPRKAYVDLSSAAQHPTNSKSAFICSFDVSVPAAQIVEEGKKVGLKFSLAYVYTARSNALMKKPVAVSSKSGSNGMMLLASAPAPQGMMGKKAYSKAGREQDMAYLLGLVIRVGLPRVEELVAEVKNRLEGLTEHR